MINALRLPLIPLLAGLSTFVGIYFSPTGGYVWIVYFLWLFITYRSPKLIFSCSLGLLPAVSPLGDGYLPTIYNLPPSLLGVLFSLVSFMIVLRPASSGTGLANALHDSTTKDISFIPKVRMLLSALLVFILISSIVLSVSTTQFRQFVILALFVVAFLLTLRPPLYSCPRLGLLPIQCLISCTFASLLASGAFIQFIFLDRGANLTLFAGYTYFYYLLLCPILLIRKHPYLSYLSILVISFYAFSAGVRSTPLSIMLSIAIFLSAYCIPILFRNLRGSFSTFSRSAVINIFLILALSTLFATQYTEYRSVFVDSSSLLLPTSISRPAQPSKLESNIVRTSKIYSGLTQFLSSPFYGHGYASQSIASTSSESVMDLRNGGIVSAHISYENLFIQLLADTGIIGLLLYLSVASILAVHLYVQATAEAYVVLCCYLSSLINISLTQSDLVLPLCITFAIFLYLQHVLKRRLSPALAGK